MTVSSRTFPIPARVHALVALVVALDRHQAAIAEPDRDGGDRPAARRADRDPRQAGVGHVQGEPLPEVARARAPATSRPR